MRGDRARTVGCGIVTTPSSAPGPTPADRSDGSPGEYPRKVLFVAGAGRSGTSTMAGLMRILGLHVPQPEVVADESNPKGFGEPAWVVEYHDRLLAEAGVQVSDARPEAWFETGRVQRPRGGADPRRRVARAATSRSADRAGRQGPAAELVPPAVAGRRDRAGADAGLRHDAAPAGRGRRQQAEVLRQPARLGAPGRLVGEHAAAHRARHPRVLGGIDGGARAFVRYADLLDDWTRVTMEVAETLGLQHVLHAERGGDPRGPRLRRPGPAPGRPRPWRTWPCPPRLHELTAETWHELNRLAEPGGDTPEVHAGAGPAARGLRRALRGVRGDLPVERRGRRAARPAGGAEAGCRSPRRRRCADRLPHELRAKIPPSVRRGLRRALGRAALSRGRRPAAGFPGRVRSVGATP